MCDGEKIQSANFQNFFCNLNVICLMIFLILLSDIGFPKNFSPKETDPFNIF